jgi:hypothetical protein
MTSCAAAVSGSWVALFPYAALATGTVANGTVIATRFVSPQAYDTVQMEPTTGTTSSYQIGCWADTATGPGALLASSPVISAATAGVKQVALAVPTGPCWIGIQNVGASGAGNLRAVSNGGNQLLPGMDAPTVTLNHAWFRNGMGTALPNPFGAPVIKGTGFMPAIYLRAV